MNKFKEIDVYLNKIDLFEKYSFNDKIEKKNQLFSKNFPPFEIVNHLINIIFKKELNNYVNIEFTIKYLKNINVIKFFNDIIPELKKYYLKCKHNKYLENLNEKKIITILRQILKPYDYVINAIEKYSNKEKYLLYILEKKKLINNNYYLKKINSTIMFD
jgi:hypothetical protein